MAPASRKFCRGITFRGSTTFSNVTVGALDATTITASSIDVNGLLKAREIKITVKAEDWSDFVFTPDYKLRSLNEVEAHIQERGHLPEIPSAAEVAENGVGLAEMNTKLLQKIEELTLYVIDQNKRLSEQNEQIIDQNERISRLEKALSQK